MLPTNRTLLTALIGAAIAAMASSSQGLAQEQPEGKAMQLTVRPSGYDAQRNEALERQQKLLRRLEQSDHMVRSICINCGDQWKHQIYAPFDPIRSLGTGYRSQEEAAN